MVGQELQGEPDVFGEDARLTLAELTRICSVHAEWVIELVNEGLLDPEGGGVTSWRFSGRSVRRVRIARDLTRDLGVNLSGAALAVDLLEEIERLRISVGLLGARPRDVP